MCAQQATSSQPHNIKDTAPILKVDGKPVFLFVTPLSFNEAKKFLDINAYPDFTDPENFIILLSDVPEFEEAIEIVSEIAVQSVVAEILRREREAKKPERKRAYSGKKTRDPIVREIDKIFKKLSFKQLYAWCLFIAITLTMTIGPPYSYKGRGRRFRYDPVKVAALVLLRLIYGKKMTYEEAVERAKEANICLTIDNSKKFLSKSQLNYAALYLISGEWLDAAMLMIDDLSGYIWACAFLSDKQGYFFGDGTELSSFYYEERWVNGAQKLAKARIGVTVLARLITGTIRVVIDGTPKDISKAIKLLPRGSILLIDGFFDAEANFEACAVRYIEVHMRPTEREVVRGSFGKLARKTFDPRVYRFRKVGEKVFC